MGNCLITKLNGVVDNDNLPKYGIVKVITPYPRADTLGYPLAVAAQDGAQIPGYRLHIKTLDNHTYVQRHGTQEQLTGDVDLNDWRVNVINSSNTEHSEVEICIYDSNFMFGLGYAIEDLPMSNSVLLFTTNGTSQPDGVTGSVKGDITKLKDKFPNLMAVNIGYWSGVYGDITEAFGTSNLWDLSVNSCINITGSVESLASAMVSNGRTSGRLLITANGVITYNGSALANGKQVKVTFDPTAQGGYTVEILNK